MHTHRNPERGDSSLAVALGWFSIGLGAAELLAPGQLARMIGLRDDPRVIALLRAFGAREIGTGTAILSNPDQAAWLWARVGGDALDLSMLASAMNRQDTDNARLGAAIAAVLGVTALDLQCAAQMTGRQDRARGRPRRGARRSQDVRIERAITINRSIEEVYGFWRNLENLPRFMRHLESVQVLDAKRSRWRAKAPAGMTVEWEAEIVAEREPEWISWRSLEGSRIRNSGSVRFARAPGARGTEVHVQLLYSPPAGTIGRSIAWLFGEEPDWQIRDDLRRFKQLLEVGEVAVSEGPGLRRPAQPAANPEEIRTLAGVNR
ncbi:MAG TPA: SRPBCC family protein [Vicinamibacterales bacterium]|nr:SRPBCC family protein [Vicinamibacterales bacterium]